MSNLIISFVLGIIASIIATIPGTIMYLRWRRYSENKPLKNILNFEEDEDLIFVFSHRDFEGGILPRTSTENFMAINNMKKALLKINWTKFDTIRDTRTLERREEEKRKNLISICSAKSNTFTKEIENILLKQNKKIFRIEKDESNEEWHVTDGQFIYTSKTYSQERAYRKEGLLRKADLSKDSCLIKLEY